MVAPPWPWALCRVGGGAAAAETRLLTVTPSLVSKNNSRTLKKINTKPVKQEKTKEIFVSIKTENGPIHIHYCSCFNTNINNLAKK